MLSELTSLTTLLEAIIWPTIISGKVATFILILFFVILTALEFHAPKRKLPKKGLRLSYRTNIGLFIFNSTMLSLVSATPLLMLAKHYSGSGLFSYFSNPLWRAFLSFLLLDLLLYVWHKASHSFDVLWMFHKVHHNDSCLNVSTAFRIHILELFIITALKAAYIVILGLDRATVLINETIITVFVMFHHTNVSFKGENLLGRVLIVPYLHRAHHSMERNEHDHNYGAVLSLWDRLFGTLAELEPAKTGIKGDSPQTFIKLVKLGFTIGNRPTEFPINLEAMIAEAAYYKAEKRNFYPGQEIRDWLEAKKEIISQVYGNKPLAN
ncbi:MAG: sterol desaturase family protein [Methylococcaceae bacterium]|nr:sterol desaturase family protein [Methylococcaceae bacterium]